MADIPVVIAVDQRKVRFREIKAKPVLTPQEIKEAIDLLISMVGIKEG